MRITIAALAAVTAGAITFATATPASAQTVGFTGPWAAAVVGGDRVEAGRQHDEGVMYGLQAGYDMALGSAMRAGIEVEATDSTQRDCRSGSIRAGDRLCVEAGRDLYVGARVGRVIGAGTLAYAKIGYTNARSTVRYTSGLATGSFRDGGNADGIRLGAGLEHRLGNRTFLKGEYRYANYEAGGERHQLLAGLGFRF